MKTIRKPEFFIVGAPKCGTTSLYFYLRSHPEIFLPRRKELLFFCDDLHFNFPLLTERQFLGYYQEWGNEKTAGEVSVWNLYSSNAAQNIYRFNPRAKIIAVLRSPAEMLLALHSNHVFNGNEMMEDFKEAWAAVNERKSGKQISPVIKCPAEGLYYTEVARYTSQLSRYIEIFGSENVKVILFDDFISDLRNVYTDLLRFIGVNDSIIPPFKVYNANKTYRSETLRNLTVDAPRWLKRIGQSLFPHQSKHRDWLMKKLWQVNTKTEQRSTGDAALRKKIIEQYAEEIARLEKLLGRDLAHWKR